MNPRTYSQNSCIGSFQTQVEENARIVAHGVCDVYPTHPHEAVDEDEEVLAQRPEVVHDVRVPLVPVIDFLGGEQVEIFGEVASVVQGSQLSEYQADQLHDFEDFYIPLPVDGIGNNQYVLGCSDFIANCLNNALLVKTVS